MKILVSIVLGLLGFFAAMFLPLHLAVIAREDAGDDRPVGVMASFFLGCLALAFGAAVFVISLVIL